jgi:nucleotide-binding universal stress UspA family protein
MSPARRRTLAFDMTLHQLGSTEFGTVAPNSVLVAVDLSRTSLRAADYAAGLACRSGVAVIGVYVRHHHSLVSSAPGVAVYAQGAETELARQAGDYLAESADRLGTEHSFAVLDGSPVAAIRHLARELQVSALVVGAAEQWPRRRFGSLAVRLARTAPCPVIIVP